MQVQKSAREFSHGSDLNMGMRTTMLFGGTSMQGSTFIILNKIPVKDFQFVGKLKPKPLQV